MKSKHKGLLLAASFSILSLTTLSINKYGNTYSLVANEKQTIFTLTIDSSNCPMFRKGSNATSSQVLTSLGNPIKLNRTKTKDDLDLTNTNDSLLLKGAKDKYNSSISIDASTPFYKMLSIKADFKIMSGEEDKTQMERLLCETYNQNSSKTNDLVTNSLLKIVGDYSYFDISYKNNYGTAERQIYINSIVVEYSCLY